MGLVDHQIKAQKLPIRLVLPRQSFPIMESLRKGHVARAVFEPFLRKVDHFRIEKKLKEFGQKRNPLLIFHPQSIGLKNLVNVLKNRSGLTWIFLADAWPYCIKSYNSIEGEFAPC